MKQRFAWLEMGMWECLGRSDASVYLGIGESEKHLILFEKMRQYSNLEDLMATVTINHHQQQNQSVPRPEPEGGAECSN